MEDDLFMFLAEATAQKARTHAAGARHTMIVFATGDGIDAARDAACALVAEKGWADIAVSQEQAAADPADIADEALSKAAEGARITGAAMVVYSGDD